MTDNYGLILFMEPLPDHLNWKLSPLNPVFQCNRSGAARWDKSPEALPYFTQLDAWQKKMRTFYNVKHVVYIRSAYKAWAPGIRPWLKDCNKLIRSFWGVHGCVVHRISVAKLLNTYKRLKGFSNLADAADTPLINKLEQVYLNDPAAFTDTHTSNGASN